MALRPRPASSPAPAFIATAPGVADTALADSEDRAHRGPAERPLRFTVLPGALKLCRLDGASAVPEWAVGAPLVSITRTLDELSLIVPAVAVPEGLDAAGPYRALRLEGPLPLTAVGVLAQVATALAGARISVLCVGSFVTDTFLVPASRVRRASLALLNAGLAQTPHRERLRYGLFGTPFGRLLAVSSPEGLVWAAFGEDEAGLLEALTHARPEALPVRDDAALGPYRKALLATLEGAPFRAPLAPAGTPFQRRVWAMLREVPAGETITYAGLAEWAGLPSSGARVVAQAVAANPVALAIPCHRVVRTDARPTDFRWGAPRKQALLNFERLGQLSLFEGG